MRMVTYKGKGVATKKYLEAKVLGIEKNIVLADYEPNPTKIDTELRKKRMKKYGFRV